MMHLSDVNRMGFGAMRLTGAGIMGPPREVEEARRVLLRAVELGVDHIDTSDYYGPYVANDLIRETLHPYPPELVLVTKVGARRDEQGGWPAAFSPEEIRSAVHDNLDRLGTDRLGGVNLRLPDDWDGPITEQWEVLAELQTQGLIGDLGLSNVSAGRVAEVQDIAPVACVQNAYNIVQREDDDLVGQLAAQGIFYVPFFPIGGFAPLESTELEEIAATYDATGRQVALAWLLQRSPNILLIPGTSTVVHLEENLAAAHLALGGEDIERLDTLHERHQQSSGSH